MKSSEYWQRRFDELEAAQLRKAERYNAREVDRQFQMALAQIEKELSYWYQRLGENNSISANEARKLLAADELREFHWNVEEYIQRGKESNYSDKWKKMLENASAKMHISRLDAMKLQIQQQIEVLYGNQVDGLDGLMHEMYTEGFNRSAYTLDTGMGVHYNLATTDPRRIDAIINRPWADDGKTFSERLWRDKDKLVNALQQEMTQAVTRGDKLGDAVKNISKRMGAAKSSAARLVMTESAFISGRAQRDCFNDLGVDKYEYVATLDRKTSETCRDLDGKVFDIDDYKPGTNAPPMHCWCRSCIVPYFDDMEMLGKRAARDPETGKTVRVPADMNYTDWKSVYIDKKMSLGEWRNSKLVSIADDEQYYSKVVRGETSNLVAKNKTYRVNKLEGTQFEMYASVNAKVKPKELHDIQKALKEAIALINPPKDYTVPKIYILTIDEAMAIARYSSFHNRLTISQGEFLHSALNKDFVAPNDYRATAVHELLHWLDAMEYIDKHGTITSQAEYRQYLVKRHRKQLEKLGIKEYNVDRISGYAEECWHDGKFDEVYTEYRVLKLLKRSGENENSVF